MIVPTKYCLSLVLALLLVAVSVQGSSNDMRLSPRQRASHNGQHQRHLHQQRKHRQHAKSGHGIHDSARIPEFLKTADEIRSHPPFGRRSTDTSDFNADLEANKELYWDASDEIHRYLDEPSFYPSEPTISKPEVNPYEVQGDFFDNELIDYNHPNNERANGYLAYLIKYYVLEPVAGGITTLGRTIQQVIDEKIPYWETDIINNLDQHMNFTGTTAYAMNWVVIPLLNKHYKFMDTLLTRTGKRTALLVAKTAVAQLICEAKRMASPFITMDMFDDVTFGGAEDLPAEPMAQTYGEWEDEYGPKNSIPGGWPMTRQGAYSGLIPEGSEERIGTAMFGIDLRTYVCDPIVAFTRAYEERTAPALRIITVNYITALYSVMPYTIQVLFNKAYLLPEPGKYQVVVGGQYESLNGWTGNAVSSRVPISESDRESMIPGSYVTSSSEPLFHTDSKAESNARKVLESLLKIDNKTPISSIEHMCEPLHYGSKVSAIPFLRKLYEYLRDTEAELELSRDRQVAWYNVSNKVYYGTWFAIYKLRKSFYDSVVDLINTHHSMIYSYVSVVVEEKINAQTGCEEYFEKVERKPIVLSY